MAKEALRKETGEHVDQSGPIFVGIPSSFAQVNPKVAGVRVVISLGLFLGSEHVHIAG